MRKTLKQRKRKRALVLGGLLISLLLLVYVAIYVTVWIKVSKVDKDKICNNVFIETVDVSGMTANEAKTALEDKSAEYDKQIASLNVGAESTEVTLGEMGFCISDIDGLVNKALSYGKTGGVWSRYSELKQLKKEAKKISVSYVVDKELTQAMMEEKVTVQEEAAKDATIKRENGTFVITDEVIGKQIDIEASIEKILEYFKDEWQEKEISIDMILTEGEPKITRADLEQIKDRLGTFSTSYASGTARGTNVQIATSKINGKVLMPGEEASASEMMGPTTAENGYKEAGSYLNGEVVQSYGGGVCQVSSTLYNAILRAELEVTERSPHSMLVGYVDPSADAAIADGYKDLKFKNNQDTPIYVEGSTAGGILTFTIYGKETRAEGRKVEFVSEKISTTDPGEKFVESGDKIGLSKKADAHIGMKAKLWKVVYENGQEVERTQVNSSSYAASAAVYNVGTASDYAEASAIVKSAIASQNRSTIEAAIAAAKAKEAELAAPTVETPPAEETPSEDAGAETSLTP